MPRDGGSGGLSAESFTVLVGGSGSLERALARFFLEEGGFRVVGLVSRGVDVIREVQERRPDAVVLFEGLATEEEVGLVHRIRRVLPTARIVVVSPNPEDSWKGRSRGADAFVERWVGLQELEPILLRLLQVPSGAGEPSPVGVVATTDPGIPGEGSSPGGRPRAMDAGSRGRWYGRLQGAVAASIVMLAMFFGRGMYQAPVPAVRSEAPVSAQAHLQRAYLLLGTLVVSMEDGDPSQVVMSYALALRDERIAASTAGADTHDLDGAIDARVSPLLSQVRRGLAEDVVAVLGDVVGEEVPSPLPASAGDGSANGAGSPEPEPTDQGSPGPAASPSGPVAVASPASSPATSDPPTWSPTPSASPAPDPTPAPTRSPTPGPTGSPTATTTPTPSPSPPTTSTPSPTTTSTPSPTTTSTPSLAPSPTPSSPSSPTPSPSPTESPAGPTGSTTPSPSPTEAETPSPSPSPTEAEGPSPTGSPPPTETPVEAPTPTPTGPAEPPPPSSAAGEASVDVVVAVPFVAWAAIGLGRRRRRRRSRRP